MKIVVGSENPVKVNATKRAFSRYWSNVEVTSNEVSSGVSRMPSSEQECIKGAVNRAKNALSKNEDFAIGLEGGVLDTEYGMFLFGWVAVLDNKGNLGLGNGGRFLLPENIAERIRNGEELGPVMDDITNSKDIKKTKGAIGIFTKNKINRTEIFENAIILALVKFINKRMYGLK